MIRYIFWFACVSFFVFAVTLGWAYQRHRVLRDELNGHEYALHLDAQQASGAGVWILADGTRMDHDTLVILVARLQEEDRTVMFWIIVAVTGITLSLIAANWAWTRSRQKTKKPK